MSICHAQANWTKVLLILWGLSCSVSEISFAKNLRSSVGIVSEVKGAPDVLREPSKTLTDDLKVKSKADGYTTVLYNGAYWKAYPIIAGLKIYYGDVLSSGPDSKMVLSLQDGFKIILAKNTKVRLTPSFINSNPDSTLKTWLFLLNGKIRAYLFDHNEKPQTQFRTRTIAMGVRGTEFMLAVDQHQSKLLTIDGEIFARPIETQEAELFDRASVAFIKQDESQLSQQVDQLQSMEVSKEILLKRGQKIERSELPSSEALETLDPQTKATLLAKQQEFISQPVEPDDLAEAKEIGSNIQQLVQDNRQAELDSLSAEQPATPKFKRLLARLGFDSLNFQHEDIEASGGGLSFSLDYLPSPYSFVSLGLSRGSWNLDGLQTSSGLGPQDFEIKTEDYSHYLVTLGGRWPFTESFTAAIGLSYSGARHLTLQDRNQKKLDYHLNSSILLRFELSYQLWYDWQIFLSLGGGGNQAKVHSEDPANSYGLTDYTLDVGQGYARFGIGRQFDFP